MTPRLPPAGAPADDPRFPASGAAQGWLDRAPDRPRTHRPGAARALRAEAGYWVGIAALIGILAAEIAAGWGWAP